VADVPVTADDLDCFFTDGEFAQELTIPGVGTINAIITDFYLTDDAGSVGVESGAIMIIAKTADLPAGIGEGQQFQKGVETWEVVNVREDNTGITRLKAVRN